MEENEFRREQAAAAERMRRMHERSQFKENSHKMPPAPDFVRVGAKENHAVNQGKPPQEADILNGGGAKPQTQNKFEVKGGGGHAPSIFGDAFFAEKLREPDTALILGLLLLLFSENADRRLLLALLYILM